MSFNVNWEGSQFVHHSLAMVNRELALALLDTGQVELNLIPYEEHTFGPEVDRRFSRLAERFNRVLSGPVDCHIRHQWPPKLEPPPEGHWILIQPWEFGALPKSWLPAMQTQIDEIWVYTNYLKECYIRNGLSPERVSVIPLGVDSNRFDPAVQSMPLKTQASFKFLFLGGTILRKGIDILLNAYTRTFSSHDDVVLVIKDFGTNSFYQGRNFLEYIRQLQADPHNPEILYINHDLTPEEVAALYTACDCLVHPYRGEGFGLPIAEAMGSGLPVIVTNHGACLDFCAEDTAYLVEARETRFKEKAVLPQETLLYPWWAEPDPGDLGRLMRYVASHSQEAKEKGKRARARIARDFTWEKAALKVLERLKNISTKPIRRGELHPVEEVFFGDVQPVDLDTRASFKFLAFPDWDLQSGGWHLVLKEYLEAFEPGSDVCLVLGVEISKRGVSEAEQRVLQAIQELGKNPDAIPDIILLPGTMTPAERAGMYSAADVYVATGESGGIQHMAEAYARGRPVLEFPPASTLQELYSAAF